MAFSNLNAQQRIMVLLELLGGPKFATEMKGAAAATDLLGRNMEKSARRTFLQNQALYTLRRYAFYGTIAVTAMAGAVLKLGYNYLSAMQQARVALSPVIKSQAALNGYLSQLFTIAKFSPFVITDLAVAFRQLYAGLHPAGIQAPQIIKLMQALTDFMSASGKTGPGQMERVALAIQHLAYAGRVTGYAANQLSRLGIPAAPILRSFGVTDVRNLSKQNISADAFIRAIIGYSNTGQFRNAARRQALKTLPGLFQVARDTISQVSGRLIQGGYSGLQGTMSRLFAPHGALDKISNQTTGRGTLFALNKSITGNTGLARGLLLLLTTARNLGAVFAHVVIPAFIMGAHALIVFYPLLVALNYGLSFLAKHGTLAKWVLAGLAAEFAITHFWLLGSWTVLKLWNIATLGSITPLKNFIRFLWQAIFGIRAEGTAASNTTRKIEAMNAARRGTGAAGLAGSVLGGASVIAGAGLLGYAYSKGFTTPRPVKIGKTSVGTDIVEASGVKYVQAAGRLTRLPNQAAGTTPLTVHSHVYIDKKKVAEAVERVKSDKAATR